MRLTLGIALYSPESKNHKGCTAFEIPVPRRYELYVETRGAMLQKHTGEACLKDLPYP